MKRIFFWVVISVAIAVIIVQGMMLDMGYVRIQFSHWLIETNVWVMLCLNFAVVALIATVIYLIRGIGKGTGSAIHWARIRPKKKANNETQQGLLAFLEGDWKKAQKLLSKSATHARMPLINLLAAANAASQQGHQKDSSALLKQAHDIEGGSQLAASLTQARLHLDKERYEAALAVLVRLKNDYPKHPYVARLLLNTYIKLEDWERVTHCFDHEGAKLLALDEGNTIERDAWTKLFSTFRQNHPIQSDSTLNEDEQLAEGLSELWKRVPSKLRFEEHLIYAYTQELIALGHNDEAEVILRKALERSWSENLIDIYGLTKSSDSTEQLLHAEQWIKTRPNSPRLFLTLGRLSLRCELWGKAAEYFGTSQSLQPSLEANAELYRLSKNLEKPEAETKQLRDSLMRYIQLPELPQPRR